MPVFCWMSARWESGRAQKMSSRRKKIGLERKDEMSKNQLLIAVSNFTKLSHPDVPDYMWKDFPYWIDKDSTGYFVYMINADSKWYKFTWSEINRRTEDTLEKLHKLSKFGTNHYSGITGCRSDGFIELFKNGDCYRYKDMPLVISAAVIKDEISRRNDLNGLAELQAGDSGILS